MALRTKIAWDCKQVFPHCAFTVEADELETNLPLLLWHLSDVHYQTGNPNPGVLLHDGVTYS